MVPECYPAHVDPIVSATPAPATPAHDSSDPANLVSPPPAPASCYNLCLNKQIPHMSYMGIVF